MNAKEKIIIDYHKMDDDDKAKVIHRYHEQMCKQKGTPVMGHRIAFTHTIRHTAKHFHMSVGSTHALIKRGEGLCISQC